ncbi:MAG: polymer-forming cytoskeletal protein [Lachnospiraceae bacterium]|nr:polymer-forming cytoskeletal protein [Lachnospiraceae bacterium]
MGFFSELKEDLSQAVNELVPDEDLDEEVAETETVEKETEQAAKSAEPVVKPISQEEQKVTPAYSKQKETVVSEVSEEASEEVSTITEKMVVNGDMESSGSLDVIGTVNGNIKIRGKLNITGKITGNSEAAEVYAQEAMVTGDVTSLGSVKIGNNSVIRGNIFATSAVIAGAVKGDIDVKGPVILDSSAIVMGNIKSKAVQINNGAVIEGLCSQCYADVSPSKFFKD